MPDTAGDFWAITSYYNPLGYRRRRANYRTFRRHLAIPLLTVELAYGAPELSEADADRYVGLRGGALLWQKERLLNVALAALPAHVRYVAWLDCDIVFQRADWAAATRVALDRHALVQPYARMYRLGPDERPESVDVRSMQFGTAIAQLLVTGGAAEHDFRPNDSPNDLDRRRGLFGLAWAAERSLMERHGFYDALVVGSGDRALACAALGRPRDAIDTMRMGTAGARHYAAWAQRFHADVQGRVGAVDGALLHCWHGDPADRRYMERHLELAGLGFDPTRDIEIGDDGLWRWTAAGRRIEPFMRRYFAGRREDGRQGVTP